MRRFNLSLGGVLLRRVGYALVREEVRVVNCAVLHADVSGNVRLIFRRDGREESSCDDALRRRKKRLMAREFATANERRRGDVSANRCVSCGDFLLPFGDIGAGVLLREFWRVLLDVREAISQWSSSVSVLPLAEVVGTRWCRVGRHFGFYCRCTLSCAGVWAGVFCLRVVKGLFLMFREVFLVLRFGLFFRSKGVNFLRLTFNMVGYGLRDFRFFK